MKYKNKYLLYLIPLISVKYLFLPVILIILLTTETHSQFNTLIFKRDFNLSLSNKNIQLLGDQNGDGYDDFLIYDCQEKKSYIFFGGNPVDSIPKFIINGGWISFNLIDVNNDNHKDLVIITDDIYPNRKVKVYFGGPRLDSIPDLVFSPPPGAIDNFGWFSTVLKDFNGDGRSELVVFDAFLPYSQKYFGIFYFYNTESVFDTIPRYVMQGDSSDSIRYFQIDSYGDINGDGKTDFTFSGYHTKGGVDHYFRSFYLGNSGWDFTPALTYYQDEHLFDVNQMSITADLNKDGKDDIVIRDYGFYPYYFQYAVLKGKFPIDTIPSFGLNTQNQGIDLDQMIPLGDVNGDSFNDFMCNTYSSPHYIRLWLGGRKIHEVADKIWYGTDPGGFGRICGAVGDVNGDGVDDIAIGEVYVYPECAPGKIYIFGGDTSVQADTITSIKVNKLIKPTGYKLNDPFPNPFNPSLVISWQSSFKGRVRIKLFDILGKEVGLILDEEKQSGNNKIEFDVSKYKLTSGVYLLQVEAYANGKLLNKESKKLSYIK
jgi:hypothetical protein